MLKRSTVEEDPVDAGADEKQGSRDGEASAADGYERDPVGHGPAGNERHLHVASKLT